MKYHLRFLSDSNFLYCRNFLSLNCISNRTWSFQVNSNFLISVKNFSFFYIWLGSLGWIFPLWISHLHNSHLYSRRWVYICCVLLFLTLFKLVAISNLSEIKGVSVWKFLCMCLHISYTVFIIFKNSYIEFNLLNSDFISNLPLSLVNLFYLYQYNYTFFIHLFTKGEQNLLKGIWKFFLNICMQENLIKPSVC